MLEVKNAESCLAGVVQWLCMDPGTKKLLVRFLVRAHARVPGKFPVGSMQKAVNQ